MKVSYWSGRQPVVVIAATAACVVLGIALWRHQYVTEPVAGGVLRAFPITEIASIAFAPIAVQGLTARVPALDLTSPRSLQTSAALSAAALIAAFAAIPLLTLALVNFAPGMLPSGTYADVGTEDRPLHVIYTPAMGISIAAAAALACALALLATALVGTVFGPVLYLAGIAVIVMIQATDTSSVIALSGAGDPPYELHVWGILLAAAVCVAAVLTWAGTRAAAAPAITRMRHTAGNMPTSAVPSPGSSARSRH